MRILVSAVTAFVVLAGGSATGQSLEQTFAQGRPTNEGVRATADPIWGPLAALAGTVWAVRGSGAYSVVDRFTWVENGTAIRYVGGVPGFPVNEFIFRPGGEPGTLVALVKHMDTEKKVLFRFNYEGVLVSDWYKMFSSFGIGGVSMRQEFRLAKDGKYESRSVADSTGGRPDFPPLHGRFQHYTAEEADQIAADGTAEVEILDRQIREKMAAAAFAAKAERSARKGERAAMFGAVMQGLAQGMAEVETGGYAEAQANLDATVANINAAAAMERKQQAVAKQKEQARAAEARRAQWEENARWVAEKEQAAAEYQAGQAEAAAARESQLVAQQKASAQQRVAAHAQRASAAQSATLERQRAQATALAERAQVAARPVAVERGTASAPSTHQVPQSVPSSQPESGSIQMHVFFINIGGKTVAFEGPRAMTLAEGKAMKARLAGEAPGKYGAGATVDVRKRGPGYCAFVYQLPGKELYVMGSGNSLSEATTSMEMQVNNGKAVVHHNVVCPTNN